jgi:hypothetical protein
LPLLLLLLGQSGCELQQLLLLMLPHSLMRRILNHSLAGVQLLLVVLLVLLHVLAHQMLALLAVCALFPFPGAAARQ